MSAPRSGTHMLVRMISRALHLPWLVPVDLTNSVRINYRDWVIGVHAPWQDIQRLHLDAVLIGLRRQPDTHRASLSKFGMRLHEWEHVIQSLPSGKTLRYELLVSGDASELSRLESLIGASGVMPEAWEQRFSGPFDWCKASPQQ